jgi:phosphoglycolate phosphatase-like HAD superfamily hydrolase
MTTSRVVVLDFDGTMTDAEQEGAPFFDGYVADLATLTGGKPAIVKARATALRDAMFANPTAYAAAFGNPPEAVAPAVVDPYLRMTPIATAIFDEAGVLRDVTDRGRVGSILYYHHYEKTVATPVFRPGAGKLLTRLGQRPDLEVWVVTNSGTDHVASKIEALDATCGGGVAWLRSRVRGDAGKFRIDRSWRDAPPDLHLDGLPRPILRQRKHYHDILHGLCRGDFTRLTVIGDIFELDLSLPQALGARVGLVRGPYTPSYELAYLATLGDRAAVLEHLDAALDFIDLR